MPALSSKHVLSFRVFDQDAIGSDDVMGEYDILLDKKNMSNDNEFLRNGEECQLTLNMLPEKGTQDRQRGTPAGEIHVLVQWTAFFNAGGIDQDDDDHDDPGRAMEKLAVRTSSLA